LSPQTNSYIDHYSAFSYKITPITQELSRKKNKHYSSDSLSDYDHKEYDETIDEPKQPDKPKTFEEIMAMAKQKGEENKKELELKKQV